MNYLDFGLKIGPLITGDQYQVSAHSHCAGEATGTFTPPFSDEQLELFVLRISAATRPGMRRIQSDEWRTARDFGQALFKAVFNDAVWACFVATRNDAVRQGLGVRLKLTLDAPALANYPWEYLYDPTNAQFLALFEDTPIVRYVDLPRPLLPLSVARPLRILAVTSSPKGYPPLDIARERRILSTALSDLLQAQAIELDWLPVATLDALRGQLLKRSYHIFHFVGHGGFDEVKQDGLLMFEDASGNANLVSGERLAIILGNHRALRLAVLNACEGARTSRQDPFAGTAMTIVRTGNLPAVIAMQFEITDNAAMDFAQGLYSAMVFGRPIDAAVSQGRQAVFAAGNDIEWGTPVLYIRALDGRIFDVEPPPAYDQAQAGAVAERVRRESEPPPATPAKPAVEAPAPAPVESRSERAPAAQAVEPAPAATSPAARGQQPAARGLNWRRIGVIVLAMAILGWLGVLSVRVLTGGLGGRGQVIPTVTAAPAATSRPAASATPQPAVQRSPTAVRTSAPRPTNTRAVTHTLSPTKTSTRAPTRAATRTPVPTATNTRKPAATQTPVPQIRYPAIGLREPQNGQTVEGPYITFEWYEVPLVHAGDFYQVVYRRAGSSTWGGKCRPEGQGSCVTQPSLGRGEYEWTVFIFDSRDKTVSGSGEIRRVNWVEQSGPYGGAILVPPALRGESPVTNVSGTMRLFSLVVSAALLAWLLAGYWQALLAWWRRGLRQWGGRLAALLSTLF